MATDWVSRIIAIAALVISGGLLLINVKNRRPAAVITHACFMSEHPRDEYGNDHPATFVATISCPSAVTLQWARVRRTWRPGTQLDSNGFYRQPTREYSEQFPLTLAAGGKQRFELFPRSKPAIGSRVRIVVKTSSGHRYRSKAFVVETQDDD